MDSLKNHPTEIESFAKIQMHGHALPGRRTQGAEAVVTMQAGGRGPSPHLPPHRPRTRAALIEMGLREASSNQGGHSHPSQEHECLFSDH